jgi:hypothetical protein
MNLEIVKSNGIVSIWPGKNNAVAVTCVGKDGNSYEATIPKAEYELTMMLKELVRRKMPVDDIVKLKTLIEEYGSECYDKAGTEQSIHDAGEDI